MGLRFEWDRRKAAKNLRKHRVSFDEALTVFSDSLARIFDDTLKKTSTPKALKELQAEYRFDYSQARPNRFTGRLDATPVVVVLDPDVAEVFTTPEAVNAALRALISAMPQPIKRRATRKSVAP